MAEFVNGDGSPWVPAFPGQRPPFQPGHRLSVGNRGPLTHGVYSARRYVPLANEIAADLKRTPGLEYLGTPRFGAALSAYATALARLQLAQEWVDAMPIDEAAAAPDGGVTAPMELLLELGSRVSTLSEPLGFVPSSAHLYMQDIEAAQATVRRRDDRKQLQADLRGALSRDRAKGER